MDIIYDMIDPNIEKKKERMKKAII